MDKFMHIPQLGIAQSAAALEYLRLYKIIDKYMQPHGSALLKGELTVAVERREDRVHSFTFLCKCFTVWAAGCVFMLYANHTE